MVDWKFSPPLSVAIQFPILQTGWGAVRVTSPVQLQISLKRIGVYGARRSVEAGCAVGRSRRRNVSDARPPALNIDFAEVLTEKTIEVLYYFEEPSRVTELAKRSDNYGNTVNQVLKRLQHRGLIGSADSEYHFNGDFDRLHEFARELAHQLHRQRLEAVAPRGTLLWERHDEFLAQTETAVDAEGFHETGLAWFANYDSSFC